MAFSLADDPPARSLAFTLKRMAGAQRDFGPVDLPRAFWEPYPVNPLPTNHWPCALNRSASLAMLDLAGRIAFHGSGEGAAVPVKDHHFASWRFQTLSRMSLATYRKRQKYEKLIQASLKAITCAAKGRSLPIYLTNTATSSGTNRRDVDVSGPAAQSVAHSITSSFAVRLAVLAGQSSKSADQATEFQHGRVQTCFCKAR